MTNITADITRKNPHSR